MATSAERKRAQRERLRESGVTLLQLPVGAEDMKRLRMLHKLSGEGDSFESWAVACMVTGSAFRANSGGLLPAGSKIKRDNVTGEFGDA
jgi:hypothetical protein